MLKPNIKYRVTLTGEEREVRNEDDRFGICVRVDKIIVLLHNT